MRYPDSGGLSAEGQARREMVRLQAAQMFAQDASPVQVACRCRLTGAQLARLRAALEAGPAAWGWIEDQRWTLPRVTTLIGRLFHVRYTPRGTSYLLHRMGFTPQVPVHRAMERDEAAIAAWRAQTWAKVRG
jgi:transposase